MKIFDDNRYCVYMHVNKINNKKYIGQSANVKERWRCNGKNYFASIKFFRAIQKYGWDNFDHIIIKENLFRYEADQLEKELIKKYDTVNNGYNIKTGGSRGVLSQESLHKMSESLKRGYIEHPERIEKIRMKKLGSKVSEETKKLLMFRKNSIIIDINGELGSIRYWAKRLNMSHVPLLYKKNHYGLQFLIDYIKNKLEQNELIQ